MMIMMIRMIITIIYSYGWVYDNDDDTDDYDDDDNNNNDFMIIRT